MISHKEGKAPGLDGEPAIFTQAIELMYHCKHERGNREQIQLIGAR